jgi:hypothetical protein
MKTSVTFTKILFSELIVPINLLINKQEQNSEETKSSFKLLFRNVGTLTLKLINRLCFNLRKTGVKK